VDPLSIATHIYPQLTYPRQEARRCKQEWGCFQFDSVDSSSSSAVAGICPVRMGLKLLLLLLSTTTHTSATLNNHPPKMSSYDPIPVDGVITQEQFKASMKLVRLQIAVPISVLASISANIVCALAIKPGLRTCMRWHGIRYPRGRADIGSGDQCLVSDFDES
jgi:hypothetical protein